MMWDSVINQNRVKDFFLHVLREKRLAHAYLFAGPSGVGKDAFAIELAKTLNCPQKTLSACQNCEDCRMFESLNHPNFFLVFALPYGKNEKPGDDPIEILSNDEIISIQQQIQLKAQNHYHDIYVERANNIKINSIRAMRRALAISKYGDGKKVFLIRNAELMNDESSNALLKTLEEPTADTVIILTSACPDQIRPTIFSRCQVVRFEYLNEQDIQQALQHRENVSSNEAMLIARLSGGSYRRALDLKNKQLIELRNRAVNFLRIALYLSRKHLVKFIDEVTAEFDKSDFEQFFYLLQSWLRDAVALREGADYIENSDDINTLKNFSNHHSAFNENSTFNAIENSVSLLNKNVYIPIILLNLSIELKKIIRT